MEINRLIDDCLRFKPAKEHFCPQLKVAAGGQLGFWELINTNIPPESMLEYSRRFVGLLIDHDGKQSGSLVETLMAYIEFGPNMGNAASKMFFHSNTVRYRLTTIEKFLGEDYLERHNPFELYLALSVYNYQRTLQETSK